MKRSRTSRTRRRGGDVIGKGGFGLVYTKPEPELEKLIPQGCEWKDNYVMKVDEKTKDAEEEWTQTEILRKNVIKGAIYPETKCTLTDGRIALFSKFGGQSLLELFYSTTPITTEKQLKAAKKQAGFYGKPSPVLRNHEKIPTLIPALETLKKQLQIMNAQGISHNDVHDGNIVYDGTTARLIDFGQLTFREDDRKEEYYEVEYIIDKLKKNQKAGLRKRAVALTRRIRSHRSFQSR